MPDPSDEASIEALVAELYPLAQQAARIFAYLADFPEGVSCSDSELSSRVGDVSAEHVAIVRRSLLKECFATQEDFSTIGLDVAPGADTQVVGSVAERAVVERAFVNYGIEALVHAGAVPSRGQSRGVGGRGTGQAIPTNR